MYVSARRCVCVRACVHACVVCAHACVWVGAYVRACVRACVRGYEYVYYVYVCCAYVIMDVRFFLIINEA